MPVVTFWFVLIPFFKKIKLTHFVGILSISDKSISFFQAFIAVEKSFFESIDEQLAARTTLQLQLPEVSSLIFLHSNYNNENLSICLSSSICLTYINKIIS